MHTRTHTPTNACDYELFHEWHGLLSIKSLNYKCILYIYWKGPQTWVVLNDINSVLEAMVKKKADFAGRPQITSGIRDSCIMSEIKILLF